MNNSAWKPCVYRIDDRAKPQTKVCGLAASLCGFKASDDDERRPLFQVEAAVCSACQTVANSPQPQPNSVVASIIFQAAYQIKQDQGWNGNPELVTRIFEARSWASRLLDVVSPDVGVENQHKQISWTQKVRKKLRRKPLVGLVGSDNQKGLGHQNRDIVRWLPIDRWLKPPFDSQQANSWLKGLDSLLFVETPYDFELPAKAHSLGVRVVCVPNWEALHPGLPWLDHVDLMLCPTWRTTRMLEDWKKRFGFPWEIVSIPWPIDVSRWTFRQRQVCQRFVFINGMGGAIRPLQLSDQPVEYRRKGLDVLLDAAKLLPQLPFLVWTQTLGLPELPSNVELRLASENQAQLYEEGDVCVQPSHWEGLGLPLLECQAAGLPLVTTNAAPMNEHQPWKTIPVNRQELIQLSFDRIIPAALMQAEDLAQILESAHGQNIADASLAARAYIEQHRSWSKVSRQIADLIA